MPSAAGGQRRPACPTPWTRRSLRPTYTSTAGPAGGGGRRRRAVGGARGGRRRSGCGCWHWPSSAFSGCQRSRPRSGDRSPCRRCCSSVVSCSASGCAVACVVAARVGGGRRAAEVRGAAAPGGRRGRRRDRGGTGRGRGRPVPHVPPGDPGRPRAERLVHRSARPPIAVHSRPHRHRGQPGLRGTLGPSTAGMERAGGTDERRRSSTLIGNVASELRSIRSPTAAGDHQLPLRARRTRRIDRRNRSLGRRPDLVLRRHVLAGLAEHVAASCSKGDPVVRVRPSADPRLEEPRRPQRSRRRDRRASRSGTTSSRACREFTRVTRDRADQADENEVAASMRMEAARRRSRPRPRASPSTGRRLHEPATRTVRRRPMWSSPSAGSDRDRAA